MTDIETIADLRAKLIAVTARAATAETIKSAEKLILLGEIEAHMLTKSENSELRQIVSDVVSALASGAVCSPDASLEFMRGVPAEVGLVIGKLRDARSALPV